MGKNILLVGDVVEDVYVDVVSTRSCPENSDAPVYDIVGEERRFLGCAGNVAKNLFAFLGPADCLTVVGGMNSFCSNSLEDLGVGVVGAPWDEQGIVKRRLVQGGRIVCRVDNRRRYYSSSDYLVEKFSEWSTSGLKLDAIVVSDYGFGTITDDLARALVSIGSPVFVDSKRRDLTPFKGAELFKLNESEYVQQISEGARGEHVFVESLCRYCVATLGGAGCRLSMRGHAYRGGYSIDTMEFNQVKLDPVDVTGCGDTFLAALVAGMVIHGRDVVDSCRFANLVASNAVLTMGPYAPTKALASNMVDAFFYEGGNK